MNRVRILVGEMPRLLQEIVEDTVRLQQDMELVGMTGGHDLDVAIKSHQADVVVVSDEKDNDTTSHGELLLENPGLKVLVLRGDGREAHFLEFREIPVVEVSPQGLVDAIRAAVASGGTWAAPKEREP